MIKHIIITKEQQDKIAEEYNKKIENLMKLSIGELNHILFISKQV